MKDKYDRNINYLRISITDRCNYRCFYCMPQEHDIEAKNERLLGVEGIIKLVNAASKLGIEKVRITGGEPLIRPELEEILKGINQNKKIKKICITTNGSLLEEKLDMLVKYGVKRLNISLDTLNPQRFTKITKYGDFKTVWRGIELALLKGIKVKLNCVIVKGINDDEVEALANLTLKYPVDVRFIELMPIGEGEKYQGISGTSIKGELDKKLKLVDLEVEEGAAKYYKYEAGLGRIGFINPMSACFCERCNRVRVTSNGLIKRCLNEKSEVDILEALNKDDCGVSEDILELLREEIYNKPEKHFFGEKVKREEKNMNKIGG